MYCNLREYWSKRNCRGPPVFYSNSRNWAPGSEAWALRPPRALNVVTTMCLAWQCTTSGPSGDQKTNAATWPILGINRKP